MKYVALFLLAIFLAGCAGHTSVTTQAPDQSAPNAPADAAAAASPAQGDNSLPPAPPVGAQFTLHCATFNGPSHVIDSERMKDELINGTGSKDWYIVHSDDESDLYFGFYKTFDDRSQAKEYTRAQTDRIRVSTLVDQNGDRLFADAGFVPINTPDPPAPKEWELSSNPGFWTLQIAVYKGSAQRKQLAVDAVRGFRAHGIEAYFRHGPATSEVYIGSWPRNAVAQQQASAAEAADPNEHLLVLPQSFAGAENTTVYRNNGQKVKVVVPKLDILDPSLKLATVQYPYYYVNGVVMGHRVQLADHSWKTIPWPSYLIQVPHDNSQEEDLDDNQPADSQSPDTGQNTSQPPTTPDQQVPSIPGLGMR